MLKWKTVGGMGDEKIVGVYDANAFGMAFRIIARKEYDCVRYYVSQDIITIQQLNSLEEAKQKTEELLIGIYKELKKYVTENYPEEVWDEEKYTNNI